MCVVLLSQAAACFIHCKYPAVRLCTIKHLYRHSHHPPVTSKLWLCVCAGTARVVAQHIGGAQE